MSTSASNWYISRDENGSEYLCVTDNEGNLYSGTVKIFFAHGSDTDTSTDANQPNIPTRWHMALVFGALWLMGFVQYKALFDDYVIRAQKQVDRTGPDVIWPPMY